ncbi:hypothetical protein EUX98_g3571 [Antrodiella citrinella]|uniref:Large ribosomal subunit protein mL59 domain-containing protein n=1 Tax=Antrodiella citrinella TaxID=2447956 RepID=A0A4S4MW72_9APHY|nr:hypothetical protein EUX98_g3571 [Antrodiella citrinella]
MAAQAVHHFRLRELQPLLKASAPRTAPKVKLPNPFIARKNPESGRWAPPKYSLRQQADLVKRARQSNLLHLLPAGPKLAPSVLQQAREAAIASSSASAEAEAAHEETEVGLAAQEIEWEGEVKERVVAGAHVGNRLYAGKKRMFKGHKWERTLEKRTAKRKMLLESMPARIQRFRTVYKRRRPNPLSVPLASKSGKLPF